MVKDNRREKTRYTVVEGGMAVCTQTGGLLGLGPKDELEARILDLSITGCQLLATRGLPRQAKITLRVFLPDAPDDPIKIKAVVAHVKTVEIDDKQHCQLGIEFAKMNQTEKDLLLHRLKSGYVGHKNLDSRTNPMEKLGGGGNP